jgi:hypothetical protein
MDDLMTPEPTAIEKLAAIQAHLAGGGVIMTVTYAKATLYKKKHLGWFSATETDLFVRHGKGKVCLTFTCIKFGTYQA